MFRISWCAFWNMAQGLSSFSTADVGPPRTTDSFKESDEMATSKYNSGLSKQEEIRVSHWWMEANPRRLARWNTPRSKEKEKLMLEEERKGPRKRRCGIFGIKSGAKLGSWYLVGYTKIILGGKAGVSLGISERKDLETQLPGEVSQQL